VGKGRRADVYLEVRKRRGIYFFNETSACGSAARADDTGRCHLILPIFGTRLISFTWSIKWKNYLNSLSSKTVTISLDRQQKKIHSCVDSGSVFIIDQFK
jgi:hypothetical protein